MTKKGIIFRAYAELLRLAKRNKQSLMSHYDFNMWTCYSADGFQELFKQYVAEHHPPLRPVVERIDWSKGFEKENLIWVEHQDRNELIGKDVIVTNDGGKEWYFSSATVAEQEFRFPQGVLCRALRTDKSYRGWKIRRGKST